MGKSLLLYLQHTREKLNQSTDWLAVLDENAKAIEDDSERHNNKFANKHLFRISVISVISMPIQLIAGYYGTNFVTENGDPGIPELSMDYGYIYFWALTSASIIIGIVVAFLLIRRPRCNICCCCRRRPTNSINIPAD